MLLIRGVATIGAMAEPAEKPVEPVVESPEEGAKGEEVDWRKTTDRLIELAATNPDQFASEVMAVAKRFGGTVEEVYARLQQDPELSQFMASRALRNSFIQGVAKKLSKFLSR